MTPAAIIREAAADGVSLVLSPAGTIQAIGDQAAVNRWLPVLREHKPTILAAVAHPDDHGPGCAVTPTAGLPKLRALVNLDEVLAGACEGVVGITPEVFRALLSPEDIKDIEAGGIHPKTLRAYAKSFAEGIRSLPERTP